MAQKEATLLLKIKTAGEEALDKIRSKFVITFGDMVNIAKTVANALAEPILAFKEAEEASNKLSRAMVNQGVYTRALKEEYDAQAESLQALTTYDDDAITNAQAILQGYLGQTKVTKELTKATLDLSTAKGMDLASAAEAVGKSIGTSTNALARNGVEVNATATKQEKLAQVIDGINKKWEGQAEAAADGLGALTQLKVIFDNLVEAIGGRLAPVVILISNALKTMSTDTEQTTVSMNVLIAGIQALTQVATVVIGVFEAVGKVIGTTLGGAAEIASNIIDGNFSKAFETSGLMTQQWGEDIVDTTLKTTERLKSINDAFMAGQLEDQTKHADLERESRSQKAAAELEDANALAIAKQTRQLEQDQIDMDLLAATEENRSRVQLDARYKAQQLLFDQATNSTQKLAALNAQHEINEEKKRDIANKKLIKDREDTGRTIATLQSSNNKELAAIGKAAAITQIAIETPVAIARALGAFPPPFSFVAAGLVGVAMAAQAAHIAGVPLAEGGVVMPRPGGVQATIGEGGQAEAVIPLDKFGSLGGGSSVTIISYGGLLGSESEAREFAVAVDRELLKLRQNNESVAFDSGVV